MLFLLGVQVTFSSPVRYALLPQHLRPDELVDGNALLEGGTFLAILFGTIAGGIAVALDRGTEAACLLLVAVRGRRASPRASACRPPRPRRPSCASAATRSPRPRRSCGRPGSAATVKLSILGASWFWLVGAVFLSQIPAFAKETLGAGTGVVTLFLAAFSIGVGAGSVLCGRLMHGEVSARYVPLAALGMALFSLDLAFASMAAVPAGRRRAARRRRVPVATSPGCASLSI